VIIRVLHENQYELDGQQLDRINSLDEQLFQAVVDDGAGRYQQLLDEVLSLVRENGQALTVEDLRPSDLVLPAPDFTMDEVRSLFQQEGLIPS
jgi:hypothetical protein